MGSDRKRKDEKTKHKRNSPSPSDEGRSKRQKVKGNEELRKEKPRKEKRRSSEEKESGEKHKSKSHKHKDKSVTSLARFLSRVSVHLSDVNSYSESSLKNGTGRCLKQVDNPCYTSPVIHYGGNMHLKEPIEYCGAIRPAQVNVVKDARKPGNKVQNMWSSSPRLASALVSSSRLQVILFLANECNPEDNIIKIKFEELSKDDYFSKNNEFATWLKDKKKLFFSDLSSEAARDLFSDFVKEWNKGKLDIQYYEGITTGPRSSHAWNIKK
ncbi:putative protein PXR1-like isoform X2 [Capsicum annuum]|nr:putative protein PXR1-like isoform X2 [Capsicum annuum]